jgi:transcriptional regulator with XRE-family HTH domain
MDTPNSRLRRARENAGFETAKEAAEAMGVPVSTYTGHENGHRGFPAKRAPQYARKFKVSEEWLLYGKGAEAASDPLPSEEVLRQMVQEVIDAEVTVATKLSDLPRIVGSGLREQLERYQSDPSIVDFQAAQHVRDKGAQPRAPTKPDEQVESRNA